MRGGGIAGHPLQIVPCVDNNVASQATQCAREAVSNPRMLAIIANTSTCSSQLLPILETAQMASIGDQFFCPEDYKSSVVFPFDAGDLTLGAGAALAAAQFHSSTVVNVTIDVPAGHQGTADLATVVGSRAKVPGDIHLPFTAADLGPFAAQIVQDGGVLVDGLTQSIGIRLGQAPEAPGDIAGRSSTTRQHSMPQPSGPILAIPPMRTSYRRTTSRRPATACSTRTWRRICRTLRIGPVICS